MQYLELKNKAKRQGIRVTKDVKGKRVKLTARELRAKISRNFENSVKNAQKVIKMCQTIVVPTRYVGAPPPPPPPPPGHLSKRPVINAKRAALMTELKSALKKRGLASNK